MSYNINKINKENITMQIKNIKVQIQKNGTVWSTHNGSWEIVSNPVAINQFKELVRVFRSKRYSDMQKELQFDNSMRIIRQVEAANSDSIELTEELLEK